MELSSGDMIRYGEYKSDMTFDTSEGCWRVRAISYEGKLYQHVMRNGIVIEVFELKA